MTNTDATAIIEQAAKFGYTGIAKGNNADGKHNRAGRWYIQHQDGGSNHGMGFATYEEAEAELAELVDLMSE